jgi:tetratricopeptide (TPR) repeat protein
LKNKLILPSLVFLSLNVVNLFVVTKSSAQRTTHQKHGASTSREIAFIFFEAQKEKMLGNRKRSAELFTSILVKDKTNAGCLFELANLQLVDNRYDEAIVLAEAAFYKDRLNVWYALLLGDLYLTRGRSKEAAEVLKLSLKFNRSSVDLYIMLASVFESLGQYADAAELLKEFEIIIGRDENISDKRIELLLKTNNLNEAIQVRKALWEEDRGSIIKGIKYIEMLTVNGRESDGNKVLFDIQDMYPTNGLICFMLSDYYRKRGMEHEFIGMLKCAFNDPEFDIDRKVAFLLEMIKLGKDDRISLSIETLLDVLVSVHPNEAKTFAIAGDYYILKGNKELAEKSFQKTIERDSSRLPVWEELILLNIELGRYRRAGELCKKAQELFPMNGTIRVYSGLTLARRGFYLEAERELSLAIQYVRSNLSLSIQLYAELGIVQSELNKLEDADKSFSYVLGISPDNPNVLANYAASLLKRNDQLERAEEMAYKACVMSPGNPYYQDVFARILSVRGKNIEAKQWIKKALESSTEETAIILEHVGDILYRAEEFDEAVKYWNRSLEKKGDTERLKKKVLERKL